MSTFIKVMSAFAVAVIMSGAGCILWLILSVVQEPVAAVHPDPVNWVELNLLRLVIVDPTTGDPRMILRTIDGHPVIILLEQGQTEDQGVLDFYAGTAGQVRRVVGGQ